MLQWSKMTKEYQRRSKSCVRAALSRAPEFSPRRTQVTNRGCCSSMLKRSAVASNQTSLQFTAVIPSTTAHVLLQTTLSSLWSHQLHGRKIPPFISTNFLNEEFRDFPAAHTFNSSRKRCNAESLRKVCLCQPKLRSLK